MKWISRYGTRIIPGSCLAGAFLFIFLLTGSALALGTPAGTIIENKSTATYTDANNNSYSPVTSNTVSTTVSQVAGVLVTPASSNQNGIPGGTSNYAFTLTNTGNGSDSFTIASSGLPAGWTSVIYKDLNGDGLLTTADQVSGAYVLLTSPITLSEDQKEYGIVVITAPVSATAGNTATLNVTLTSALTPTITQTVPITTTIQAAVMTLTKSTSPANPKPGETVTYTINYSNIGTAAAYNAVFSDPIPANTTYKVNTITVGGSSRTDTNTDYPGDNADFNFTTPGNVTVKLGTVSASGSGVITFQVTVNTGISSATQVINTASVTYQTSNNVPSTSTTVNSNGSPFTVGQATGILLTPATLTTNELVGNLNQHPFTLKNTGNGSDTYNFTSVGLYWTWQIYFDNDLSGTYSSGDTLVIDSNGDGKLDSGVIASGSTGYFIATTTITGFNGQVGQHTLTATSIYNSSTVATSIKYTNIQTPVIALVKSVSPTGAQPPTTELTYTINVTNSGAATARNFAATDNLSAFLDYVEGSIVVGTSTQTDAADGDFSTYDAASNTITVVIPTISAGATVPITFKVLIK